MDPLARQFFMRPKATAATHQQASLKPLLYQGAIGLHKGNRPYQQDQVAIFPHHYVPGCSLAVVADGMGGKTGGRTASDQVIQTCRQLFTTYSPFHDDPGMFLKQVAMETHLIVRLTSITSEEEPHTTFAAFLLLPDDHAHIAHCGDSRVYLFRKNKLLYRTHDHSYIQTLIDAGKVTEKEALTHPKSNLITSCLGIFSDQGPTISQYASPKLIEGDVLVACSDGLWHGVNTEEIGWATSKFGPREACQRLTNQAFQRAEGRSDNISIAIVKVMQS